MMDFWGMVARAATFSLLAEAATFSPHLIPWRLNCCCWHLIWVTLV